MPLTRQSRRGGAAVRRDFAGGVPEPGGLVLGAGEDELAVGAERHRKARLTCIEDFPQFRHLTAPGGQVGADDPVVFDETGLVRDLQATGHPEKAVIHIPLIA